MAPRAGDKRACFRTAIGGLERSWIRPSVTKHCAASAPGMRAAAIASRVDVLQRADVTIEGTNEPLAGSRGRSISPNYLRLMGIPLLAGRDFNGRDTTTSPKVMLVNQTFARRFFPDRHPVGQRGRRPTRPAASCVRRRAPAAAGLYGSEKNGFAEFPASSVSQTDEVMVARCYPA